MLFSNMLLFSTWSWCGCVYLLSWVLKLFKLFKSRAPPVFDAELGGSTPQLASGLRRNLGLAESAFPGLLSKPVQV